MNTPLRDIWDTHPDDWKIWTALIKKIHREKTYIHYKDLRKSGGDQSPLICDLYLFAYKKFKGPIKERKELAANMICSIMYWMFTGNDVDDIDFANVAPFSLGGYSFLCLVKAIK